MAAPCGVVDGHEPEHHERCKRFAACAGEVQLGDDDEETSGPQEGGDCGDT